MGNASLMAFTRAIGVCAGGQQLFSLWGSAATLLRRDRLVLLDVNAVAEELSKSIPQLARSPCKVDGAYDLCSIQQYSREKLSVKKISRLLKRTEGALRSKSA
jgi:hypothetical protein